LSPLVNNEEKGKNIHRRTEEREARMKKNNKKNRKKERI